MRTSSHDAVGRLLDQRAHGHHRPVLLAAVELLVAVAVAVERREPDLGEDLVLADRGRQVVLEQVGGRDLALAAGAARPPREPSAASRIAGMSDAGSPCASVPPIVPDVADLLVGDRRRRGARRARSRRWRRRDGGPSRRSATVPLSRETPSSPGTRRRSTSSVGAASRSFISGISECPPASSFASSPPSRSAVERLVERGRARRSRTQRGSRLRLLDRFPDPHGTRAACSCR